MIKDFAKGFITGGGIGRFGAFLLAHDLGLRASCIDFRVQHLGQMLFSLAEGVLHVNKHFC